jgi:hypothetical protein
MKLYLSIFIIVFSAAFLLLFLHNVPAYHLRNPLVDQYWEIQSIDTMKLSRDQARKALKTPDYEKVIDKQMSEIADTGANYVALGTPYDDEFLPVMKMWVKGARKYGLHIWFRGNFSGWEGWFGYPPMDRTTHTAKIHEYIVNHPELFEDGDIFSSCPECENGAKIDTGNQAALDEYKAFLISDYTSTKQAFAQINKKVASNYYAMNGHLATLIMDPDTTRALDGLVVIDHYVKTPEQLADDIRTIAAQSGGKVILGEFGAPIPDIHGKMTEEEQKDWIEKSLVLLKDIPDLKGINYWTSSGGSTALWLDDGTPRAAVDVIKTFYLTR